VKIPTATPDKPSAATPREEKICASGQDTLAAMSNLLTDDFCSISCDGIYGLVLGWFC
jgi:hypothetical protein